MLERSKKLIPVFTYGIFYLGAFRWLETHPRKPHIIFSSIDAKIPFCEYFIVPYFLWFLYIAVTILYFAYKNNNRTEYVNLLFNLGIGMTFFLIVSYVYPNGLQLRPTVFPRDNIFTKAVQFLYSIDTATNVLPSIHVYNSIAAFCAINECAKLQKHPWIRWGACILTISIVLSTMFLKQHSIVDVVTGLAFSMVSYMVIYRIPERSPSHSKSRHRRELVR